ncbi:MAG: NDP-sugar synthase [Thermoplasmata archaeon]
MVLAGGLGTRLRPITLSRPKPLMPVCNRPLVLWALELLPPEVDEVFVAVGYKGELVRKLFEEIGGWRNLCVRVEVEETPLGTGGPLKRLEKHLQDTFAVINGDVLCSLDIGEMLRYHKKMGGLGTIAIWEVDDPGAYGMVVLDGEGRINRFVEKPGLGEAVSRLINAGSYVLEPEILQYMESARELSIERDVFPRVLEKGLYGFKFRGYWFDAGTLDSYLKAHACLMKGVTKGPGVEEGAGVVWRPPVLTGDGCRVGPGSRIGPAVCLGRCVLVGRDCTLENSVLHDGASVGDGARLEGCIVGEGASVEDGAIVMGRIIGDGERAV